MSRIAVDGTAGPTILSQEAFGGFPQADTTNLGFEGAPFLPSQGSGFSVTTEKGLETIDAKAPGRSLFAAGLGAPAPFDDDPSQVPDPGPPVCALEVAHAAQAALMRKSNRLQSQIPVEKSAREGRKWGKPSPRLTELHDKGLAPTGEAATLEGPACAIEQGLQAGVGASLRAMSKARGGAVKSSEPGADATEMTGSNLEAPQDPTLRIAEHRDVATAPGPGGERSLGHVLEQARDREASSREVEQQILLEDQLVDRALLQEPEHVVTAGDLDVVVEPMPARQLGCPSRRRVESVQRQNRFDLVLSERGQQRADASPEIGKKPTSEPGVAEVCPGPLASPCSGRYVRIVDEDILMRLVQTDAISAEQASWAHDESGRAQCSISRVLLESGLVDAGRLRALVQEIQVERSRAPVSTQAAGDGTDDTYERIIEAQKGTDKMLRALFELCVARGWVDPDDFIRKLSSLESVDLPRDAP